MSADEHPSSFELEALHVGDGDPGVRAHAASCAACEAYLAQLTTEAARFAATRDPEAFVRLVRRRVAAGEAVAGPVRRSRPGRRALVASAALAALAAVVLWVSFARPDAPADEVRGKGGIEVAAIVLHGDAQMRKTGEIVGAPGDRFRVEITLAAPAVLDARVVDDRGRSIVLCAGRRFQAGTYHLEPTLAFDDSPTAARLLVGSAIGVQREMEGGRAGKDVVVIPVRSEGHR